MITVEWGFDMSSTALTLGQLDEILDEIHHSSSGADVQTDTLITGDGWSVSISLGGERSHLEHHDSRCNPGLVVSYCANGGDNSFTIDSFGSYSRPPGETFVDVVSAREVIRRLVQHHSRPRNIDWSCVSADGTMIVVPAVLSALTE